MTEQDRSSPVVTNDRVQNSDLLDMARNGSVVGADEYVCHGGSSGEPALQREALGPRRAPRHPTRRQSSAPCRRRLSQLRRQSGQASVQSASSVPHTPRRGSEDAFEHLLDVVCLAKLWRVPGAVFEAIGEEACPRLEVLDAGRLEADLEFVWCQVERDLAPSTHDLGEGPHS